ncbi:hypothetical protein L6164_009465 [Bauhinia variegata]|uniref:Uncharacterized protein n=1 Tax=Bauhinia variegata TaxID=167791 RepID=A0ACB9PJU4_BAUVA|nr:hypothetical protein L6164_009465 [Bauhinia variegata]
MGTHSNSAAESEKRLHVSHFSHPHPLQLQPSNPPNTAAPNLTCSGCNLNITSGNDYYQCETCAFALHYLCYKMPMITRHPAHSTHDLVLLFIRPFPPATKATIKCFACGHYVTGFCYHCGECTNVYYHSLCLAMPISITISYHTHNMKLEFSPPYDFYCDLCQKPSYNGWLYRCNMCEFDTHLACAIQNLESKSLENPSFFKSNTLLKHITSTQLTNKNINGSVDKNIVAVGYELMHLVSQKIGGEITSNSKASAVSGWDKRLRSPKRKNITKLIELQKTEPSPVGSSAEKMTPRSDVASPSYQFSEGLFSIDLTKPFDPKSQLVTKEAGNLDATRSVGDQVKETTGHGVASKPMPQSMLSNSGQANQPFVLSNWPSFNSCNASRMKEAFLNAQTTGDFGRSSSQITYKQESVSPNSFTAPHAYD